MANSKRKREGGKPQPGKDKCGIELRALVFVLTQIKRRFKRTFYYGAALSGSELQNIGV